MADHYYIVCRAQVARDCLNFKPSRVQFGEDRPLDEDGTYQDGSIVCDPCFIDLMPLTPSGKGLIGELPAAIEQLRPR